MLRPLVRFRCAVVLRVLLSVYRVRARLLRFSACGEAFDLCVDVHTQRRSRFAQPCARVLVLLRWPKSNLQSL